MRRLSLRQIRKCETARSQRCKCRCKGALHGVCRGEWVQGQLPLFTLPPEQQHYQVQPEQAA